MAEVNVAVIYYSATGTNHKMATVAADAAREAGAEVRLRQVPELAPPSAIDKNPAWRKFRDATRSVPEATLDDLDWADAILFSVPTRFGNMASQMKQFFDTAGPLWGQGKLANKVVSAMATAANPHGGQEATILALYNTMYHWGAIVVAPGYTDAALYAAGGNPYGTSTTAMAQGDLPEAVAGAVRAQTRRLLEVSSWVKAGRSVKV
jgi:NAD(P)H dehydrogenase (quinone)